MTRTREEHLKHCKENAYKQYEFDMSGKEYAQPDKAITNACTSMLCDLAKHPETGSICKAAVFLMLTVQDYNSMKRFIDGFN